MKTIFRLAPAILMVFLTFSCITARINAYKTLAATAHTVDTAMKAYADARVAGKVDDATHIEIVKLKKQYEKVFLESATLAQADLTSYSPTNLISIASQLVTSIENIIKK